MLGVPEEQGENVDNKVNQLFEKLDQESHTADRSRIGQSKPDMLRPIRFKVKRSDSVDQNLRRAKQLEDTDGNKRVCISPDRTVECRGADQLTEVGE